MLTDELHGETDHAAGLRHFDNLLASTEDETGFPNVAGHAARVRRLGVIGAGIMGTALAAAALRRQLAVVLHDRVDGAIRAARDRVLAELRGDLSASDAERAVERRLVLSERPEFDGCDLVLESIVETASAKREAYADVERQLRSDALLATNTSTIPIAQLAAGLQAPGRFCGVHFFHPVRRRPLVEIVRGPATSAATIAAATAFARQIGKLPIVVDDGPGFLVNRLLLPYLNEALDLLLDGVEIKTIESVAMGFGMAMGPLRLLDEIGLDTALRGGMVLFSAFPERIAASPLLVTMVKRGRLGRKTGVGFFRYAADGDRRCLGPDGQALSLIRQWLRASAAPPTREAISARLFLPMLLEATRVLEEGRVGHPRDVDLAVILGLGFPAARGGLLYWADTLGVRQVLARLATLDSLGPRARPTAPLLEMARSGGRFYRWPLRGTSRILAGLRRPA